MRTRKQSQIGNQYTKVYDLTNSSLNEIANFFPTAVEFRIAKSSFFTPKTYQKPKKSTVQKILYENDYTDEQLVVIII